jgi:hypothetical protein
VRARITQLHGQVLHWTTRLEGELYGAPAQLQLTVKTSEHGVNPLLLRDPCSLCRFLLLALDGLIGQLLLPLGFGIGIGVAEQCCQKSLAKLLRENGRVGVFDIINDPEIRAEV